MKRKTMEGTRRDNRILARSIFDDETLRRPGAECNSRIRKVFTPSRERGVVRGAFGRVVFGRATSADRRAPGSIAQPARGSSVAVVIKIQHVYMSEARQRVCELRLLRALNALVREGYPCYMETFYAWSWQSKRDLQAARPVWCMGCVMEEAKCDMLQLMATWYDRRPSNAWLVVSVSYQTLAAHWLTLRHTGLVHGDMKCNNTLLVRAAPSVRATRAWGRRRDVRLHGWDAALGDFGAVQPLIQALDETVRCRSEGRGERFAITMWTAKGSATAARLVPVHEYTYQGIDSAHRLHDSTTRRGVLPVWIDYIQWFSSLLEFNDVDERASPGALAWRTWSLRALELCRWFEESSYRAMGAMLDATGDADAAATSARRALRAIDRLHPSQPSQPSRGAPTAPAPVERDAMSIKNWRADIASGRCYHREYAVASIQRDAQRFLNIIFSQIFIQSSGVDPHGSFSTPPPVRAGRGPRVVDFDAKRRPPAVAYEALAMDDASRGPLGDLSRTTPRQDDGTTA